MKLFRLAAIGAALFYFLDPRSGARRRSEARERALVFFRRRRRDAEHVGRAASSEANALKERAAHLREEPKVFDDQTLKAKVESEVFRPEGAPKGEVDVNVEHGVVYLRGQVEQQSIIDDLAERVRAVQGVNRVENLLHLPGSEAPTKQS